VSIFTYTHLGVAGGVKVVEDGDFVVVTVQVETPRGRVLRTIGRLDVDVSSALRPNQTLRLRHQQTSEPLPLARAIHRDPVQIKTADRTSDRPVTGIADRAASALGKHEVVS